MDSVVVCAAVFVGLGFLTFVSGKDASTQTTERLTMLEELKNMEVIDYIRAGALCIGLVAPLIRGKKNLADGSHPWGSSWISPLCF